MTAALKKKVPTIKSQSDQSLDMKPRVVSSQKLEYGLYILGVVKTLHTENKQHKYLNYNHYT